jgi:hypothetical protein
MNPDRIREHLRREPFQPIRICMSDGAVFEVRHPELAAIARTQVAIAVARAEDELPESFVFCDPLHVTRIEPIAGAAAVRGEAG